MKRLFGLALALTTLACGAAPEAPPPPPPPGAPVDLAAWVVIRPAALDRALADFEARLGDTAALGPFGAALGRARAALEDRLADLAPAGGQAADVWAGWGLDRAAPVRIGLASPEGGDVAHALGRALSGEPAGLAGLALWRARITARVVDAGRLRVGLDRLAARLGWQVESTAESWRARDPSGLALALTVRGSDAALDVALPADPGGVVEAPLTAEIPWPDTPPAPLAGGVRPAAVARLDAGLIAAGALARADAADAAGARALTAAARVVTLCLDRWRAAEAHVAQSTLALDAPDGRPRLMAGIELSPTGAAAWRAAIRPLPLATLGGLPAAIQVGAEPAAFGGDGLAEWPESIAACPAGHPALSWPIALGLAPALARPERLPVPGPVDGWPEGRGVAAAITGAAAVEGQAVPALAGLVVVGPDHPVHPAPLGPGASAPAPGVSARPGPMPVTFGEHPLRGGRALIFGLGRGAHRALLDRLAQPADTGPAPVLEARVDPAALAAALADAGEAGPGVAALAALGARFGRWRIAAAHAGDRVRWVIDAAPAPGRELDRAPPSK